MSEHQEICIRPTEPGEKEAVLRLIEPAVRHDKLLPRLVDELDELIENSFVATMDDEIVGFAALDIYSRKLAEIRGLVVDDRCQGMGVGKRLVEACVALAWQHDVMEVMAISSSESFFRTCGFDFTLPDEKKAFFLQTRERH